MWCRGFRSGNGSGSQPTAGFAALQLNFFVDTNAQAVETRLHARFDPVGRLPAAFRAATADQPFLAPTFSPRSRVARSPLAILHAPGMTADLFKRDFAWLTWSHEKAAYEGRLLFRV